ncbi:MAG: nucleotidyl transferase AbiEii/AbiGii toxin family protein [Fimbriimonadaceae bacterium]|nr:nucleotidyl transferase AbiEii/AbiGii toxin family protein [Fimbriimonadaceae bacterium]
MLNSHHVEYVVVGAHALAFHGHPRLTRDIDFFVLVSPENAKRLMAVLVEFGFGSTGVTEADLAKSGKTFMLGVAPYRIDILTSISGVEFGEVYSRRVMGDLAGIPTAFISREDLITNKRSSGRMKDLGDVESMGEK